MMYHVPDNDDAPDRSYGAPRRTTCDVGRCEMCGTDRFVRVLKNRARICVACQDKLAASTPDYDDPTEDRMREELHATE